MRHARRDRVLMWQVLRRRNDMRSGANGRLSVGRVDAVDEQRLLIRIVCLHTVEVERIDGFIRGCEPDISKGGDETRADVDAYLCLDAGSEPSPTPNGLTVDDSSTALKPACPMFTEAEQHPSVRHRRSQMIPDLRMCKSRRLVGGGKATRSGLISG